MRPVCLFFLCFIVVESHVAFPSTNVSSLRLSLFEGDSVIVKSQLTYSLLNQSIVNETLSLKCWMDDINVGALSNWTDIYIPYQSADNISYTLQTTVLAKRLGGSKILCGIRLEKENDEYVMIHQNLVAMLIVSRVSTIPEMIFRYCLIFFIIFLTFVMGSELDTKIIFSYLRNPISPSIGFVSQFICMPLIALTLAKLTNIDSAFGFGLLTIGCSPGGGASNLWTVLLGGDLNLSMTMTFISSCFALFMMPFWLFVLGRFFIDPNELVIPYGGIGLNLLQIVLPVAVGMLFRWKFESQAAILAKKVKIMGILLIIFILTFGSYVNFYLFKLMADYPYIIPLGFSLPWIGFVFGFLLSLVTRRTQSQAIAIALETGIQNIGIAILILKYSMPQPAGDLGSVMPIIVGLFTPIPLYIAYAALTLKRKCYDKPKKTEDLEMDPLKKEQKEVLLVHVAV